MSKVEMILARVLVDAVINKVTVFANQLVEGPADVVEHHCKAGELDSSDAAVAYCKKQGAEPVPLVEKPTVEDITDEVIIEAIMALDEKDESLWTKSGTPKTDAIAKQLGVEAAAIKAADRDAAWRMIQDGEV